MTTDKITAFDIRLRSRKKKTWMRLTCFSLSYYNTCYTFHIRLWCMTSTARTQDNRLTDPIFNNNSVIHIDVGGLCGDETISELAGNSNNSKLNARVIDFFYRKQPWLVWLPYCFHSNSGRSSFVLSLSFDFIWFDSDSFVVHMFTQYLVGSAV